MAKKKSAPTKAASKTGSKSKTAATAVASRKPSGKKPAANTRNGRDDGHTHDHGHHNGHDHSECCGIELDDVSANAVEMAESKKFSEELDEAVNKSVFVAVRKFYREHGMSLSAEQAQNVAFVLFGE